ncbi:MAG: tetratricopeptide repeat protein, partial [Candidatus Limnocylindria bacterium]
MPTFRASPIRIGAAALIILGILGIAIALLLSGNDDRARGERPSGAVPSASTGAVDSAATIDGRIAFWEARVAANATDYSSTLALIDAYLTRVRATGDLSDITRAETALDRARDLAPVNDVGLTLREGFVAFTSHQFVEARDAAQDVLQRDPGNESAVALYGDASIELGHEVAARRAYEELEPLETAAVLLRVARLEQLTGDLEAAEATMHSAIATAETEGFPDQVAAYRLQLAELLRGENRLDEA